jgi:hypothetical protein
MSDKRIITDDHRQNWATNNKTDIFFAQNKKEEKQVDHKAMLKEKRTQSNFKPRFNEETAFNKKVKEFYNKSTNKDMISSQGYIEKEKVLNNKKEISNLISTPKERKMFQLNPNIKEENLKNVQNTKIFERNSTASRYDNTKTTKEIRNENLVSNIFHDPEKIEQIERFRTKSVHIKNNIKEKLKTENLPKPKVRKEKPVQ